MLDKQRARRLVVRWSVFTAIIVILFWAGWYFINGSVPVIREIKIADNWTVTFPLGVSRWWDILVGPIFFSIFILAIHKGYLNERNMGTSALAITTAGLMVLLNSPLGTTLFVVVIASVVIATLLGFLDFDIDHNPLDVIRVIYSGVGSAVVFLSVAGLSIILISGLVSGIAYGVIHGVAFGIVGLLAFAISYALIRMFFFLFVGVGTPLLRLLCDWLYAA